MSTNDTHAAATNWLLQHGKTLPRNEVVDRCTAHLIDALEISRDSASLAALQAMADIECAGQRAWIDISASTGNVVVVRRPDGSPRAYTVRDLMRVHTLAATSAPNVH